MRRGQGRLSFGFEFGFSETMMRTRPAGVLAIALLFFTAALASAITEACTAWGVWPLAWGRYVAGNMVTMGPVVFGVAALIYAVIGTGLLWLKNWARRLAIAVTAVGLYFLIPGVSSAVADFRIGSIALNGALIIIRVVVLWYLMQYDVGKAFGQV
jgi:hypothetical protein